MELTARQIYYKQYYKDHRDHILEVVQKYQDSHKEAKKAYYTKYNREYYLKHKQTQMKPIVKPPRQVKEKLKKIPLEVTTLLAETKTEVKKPVRTPKPKVPEAPKAPQKVAKEKPKYEHLKGNYTLSFD